MKFLEKSKILVENEESPEFAKNKMAVARVEKFTRIVVIFSSRQVFERFVGQLS